MSVHQHIRVVYRRPGKATSVYDQELILDRADLKVLLTRRYGGPTVRVGGRAILEEGASILWFVVPDAWHEVARFHRADGGFTGWYTNLCTPVTVSPDAWEITDLFLDHWLPLAGPARWLDADEFEIAVRTGLLDANLANRAERERAAIESRVATHRWPPTAVRAAFAALDWPPVEPSPFGGEV